MFALKTLLLSPSQRGQRSGPGGGAAAVWRQPDRGAAGLRTRVPGLFRLLRHRGPAVVRAPLALPARHQGHALHGPDEHLLAGLRGRPAAGLPAHARVPGELAERARGHPDQLRHRLLRRHLPARHLDRGALQRARDAAPARALRRPRARLHAGQAVALPLRGPGHLLPHLRAEQVQCAHLPPDGDHRALRLPGAAALCAGGAGAAAPHLLPRAGRTQVHPGAGRRRDPGALQSSGDLALLVPLEGTDGGT